MSAAIVSIIRRIGAGDRFNDVTLYPDAALELWIADALQDVPVSRLGVKADRAVAYYTCHLMLQGSGSVSSTGGSVKKQKAGDVEIEYNAANASMSAVSDKYYETYLQLIAQNTRVSPIVLNGQ